MRIHELPLILAQSKVSEGLRDIKPPIEVQQGLSTLWAAVAAVTVVLVFFAWKFSQRLLSKRRAPRPEPWQIALKQLDQLHQENLIANNAYEPYYVRLSDIVRFYFEQRFNIQAPEMTSEEFLRHIQDKNELRSELQESLKEFLTASDMVKFAKYQSDRDEAEKNFVMVKKLIEVNQ